MSREIPTRWGDVLDVSRPLIFGIHNVTPDSFSDGGEYTDDESHRTHIDVLIEHGAHVIDVGAESTRPGAQEVPPSEELRRLAPVFDFVSNCDADILFSIDTRHHEVAVSALDVGFQIVNDISAGAFDSKMVNTVKEHGALFIAMHSRGTPETMKDLAVYDDVVAEVTSELRASVEWLSSEGLDREKIMVDIGIGFAKSPEDNVILLDHAHEIRDAMGFPMMVGLSRKSVVGHILAERGLEDSLFTRDQVSAQLCGDLIRRGVDAVRVHNVLETAETINQLT